MWGLVPWQRVEPRPPALGVWSLSHWTGREVPCIWFFFLMCGSKNKIYLLRLLSFKHIPTDNQGRKRQEGAQDENITRSTWKANRGPKYSTGSPASCHQNGNARLPFFKIGFSRPWRFCCWLSILGQELGALVPPRSAKNQFYALGWLIFSEPHFPPYL